MIWVYYTVEGEHVKSGVILYVYKYKGGKEGKLNLCDLIPCY